MTSRISHTSFDARAPRDPRRSCATIEPARPARRALTWLATGWPRWLW